MLKKLAEKGHIDYSPYHGTKLASNGKRIAEKTARKHRLLERFLHDVLKIDNVKVHKQACEMEHSLSDDAEESLCRFLRHPDRCPDDEKAIPPCDLRISNCEECIHLHSKGLEEVGKHHQHLVPIDNLKQGHCGKISFISLMFLPSTITASFPSTRNPRVAFLPFTVIIQTIRRPFYRRAYSVRPF